MDESVKIRAKTTYTRSSFLKMQYNHMLWVGVRGKFTMVCVGFALIVGIISMVKSYLDNNLSNDFISVYPIMFAAIFLLMPLIVTYSAFTKKSNVLYKTESDYSFFEDHFVVEIEKEIISMTNNVKLAGLTRVYEAKDCFYLYISKTQVFIVTKEGFTLGTPGELSVMLRGIVPAKNYHKYGK